MPLNRAADLDLETAPDLPGLVDGGVELSPGPLQCPSVLGPAVEFGSREQIPGVRCI